MPMTTSCRATTKGRGILQQLRRLALPGLFLFVGGAFGNPAVAAPYTPETDDQVLQRLPTPSILDGADALQEKLADDPRDRDSAEQLARLYIQAARRETDKVAAEATATRRHSSTQRACCIACCALPAAFAERPTGLEGRASDGPVRHGAGQLGGGYLPTHLPT